MTLLNCIHTTLNQHRRSALAATWRITYAFGHGAGAARREIVIVAPPKLADVVLARIHNGILLLHPAAVRIHAPVPQAQLQPLLNVLRGLHALPISVGDEAFEGLDRGPVDVPLIALSPGPVGGITGVAVGLDIGGTGMKCVALRDGQAVDKAHAPTWPDGESGIESLVSRARALVQETAAGEPIGALGVGFASPMSVDGTVVSLSTVMRQRLGGLDAARDFPLRVAAGLTSGPVAFFNDLANLGRHLSGRGRRRLLRLQVGTSFGGCWIDADGTVNGAELGRLIVDGGAGARPHTYLPIAGAMKSYLSGYGVTLTLKDLIGEDLTAWDAGYRWAELVSAGDPRGRELAAWVAELLVGVIAEARAFLPGLLEVEVGGSMLRGGTGRLVRTEVRARLDRLQSPPSFAISLDPGYDGAIAAAWAPLIDAPLRGMRRLAGG